MSAVAEPERIARLPHHGRFPVPVVVPWDDAGVPDFTATDDAAYLRVVRENRCGLCGDPLDYWMAFIGGPISMRTRCFTDAAMHLDCATYAIQTCPYLVMRTTGHAARPHRAGARTDVSPGLSMKRPDRFGLMVTRGFKITLEQGVPALKADRPQRIEWYANGEPIKQ
jgi:hypothetical protein